MLPARRGEQPNHDSRRLAPRTAFLGSCPRRSLDWKSPTWLPLKEPSVGSFGASDCHGEGLEAGCCVAISGALMSMVAVAKAMLFLTG